jgi:hypothetical protein
MIGRAPQGVEGRVLRGFRPARPRDDLRLPTYDDVGTTPPAHALSFG